MSEKLELLPKEEPSALESIERASIDIQIATAHRFPRTLSKVKADMLSFATLDEETALSTFYTLPRGGKTIQGPSVRMAEIAIACYGNLRAGARPIQTVTTGDHPHVIVQAVAHDLEKNVAITIEKRRRIVGKKSKGGAIDEDDINLAVNACSAIAFRDAVFKVVPQALIKPVFEQAKAVAVGDIKSLGVKRTKTVERLTQMGAKLENILARVEAKKIEDIDLSRLEMLIGLGTALKDGETTLEDAFPNPAVEPAIPAIFDSVEKPKREAKAPKEAPAPAKEEAPEPSLTPEPEAKPAAEVAVAEAAKIDTTKSEFRAKLEDLLLDHGVTEKALIDWAVSSKHLSEGATSVSQIPELKAAMFVNNFAKIVEKIKGKAA